MTQFVCDGWELWTWSEFYSFFFVVRVRSIIVEILWNLTLFYVSIMTHSLSFWILMLSFSFSLLRWSLLFLSVQLFYLCLENPLSLSLQESNAMTVLQCRTLPLSFSMANEWFICLVTWSCEEKQNKISHSHYK